MVDKQQHRILLAIPPDILMHIRIRIFGWGLFWQIDHTIVCIFLLFCRGCYLFGYNIVGIWHEDDTEWHLLVRLRVGVEVKGCYLWWLSDICGQVFNVDILGLYCLTIGNSIVIIAGWWCGCWWRGCWWWVSIFVGICIYIGVVLCDVI